MDSGWAYPIDKIGGKTRRLHHFVGMKSRCGYLTIDKLTYINTSENYHIKQFCKKCISYGAPLPKKVIS